MEAFWTIEYGEREDTDYSSDEGMYMKYAYVRWDANNELQEDTMRKQKNRWYMDMPCMSWLKEIEDHIGADHYIYTIKCKWDGEMLIFYRELKYKDEWEDSRKTEGQKLFIEWYGEEEDVF